MESYHLELELLSGCNKDVAIYIVWRWLLCTMY